MRHLTVLFIISLIYQFTFADNRRDSLELIRMEAELKAADNLTKLQLLEKFSWALRGRNNPQSQDYSISGRILALEIADSAAYYKLGKNLAVTYAMESQIDTAISILNSALFYFTKMEQEAVLKEIYSVKSAVLAFKGDYSAANEIFQLLASFQDTLKPNLEYANYLIERGVNYLYWEKFELGKHDFLQALPIYKIFKDSNNICRIYQNLGVAYAEQDYHAQALEYYFKALPYAEKPLPKSRLFNNIGNVYHFNEDWDKALEYHLSALELKRKLGYPRSIATTLHNIGTVHKAKKNYGDALQYFQKAIDLKLNIEGENKDLESSYNMVGEIYFELNNLEKAMTYFQKGLASSIASQNKSSQSDALNHLAKIQVRKENFRKAIVLAQESRSLAIPLNDLISLEINAKVLADAYAGLGDYKMALQFFQRQQEAKDSLAKTAQAKKILKMERDFALEKERETVELQKRLLTNLEEKANISQQRNLFLIIGVISLILFSLALFFYQKQRIEKIKQVSELTASKLKTEQLQNELLSKNLLNNQMQLDNYLSTFLEKTALLDNISQVIQQKEATVETEILQNLSTLLKENLTAESDYETFQYYFSLVHKDFFKNLIQTYGHLTPQELNLCALIKINMVNKDIAKLLNISPDSVKKSRQRLYKKLKLTDNEALRTALIQL